MRQDVMARDRKYDVRLPTVLVTQKMKDELKSAALREGKSLNEMVRRGIQKVIDGSTENYLREVEGPND